MLFVVGIVSLIIGLLCHYSNRPDKPIIRNSAPVFLAVAVILCLQILSYPLGKHYTEIGVRASKIYLQNLVPLIEAYKEEHGVYPGAISEIDTSGFEKPFYLGDRYYSCHGPRVEYFLVVPDYYNSIDWTLHLLEVPERFEWHADDRFD